MDRHGTRITTTSENQKKKNAYSAEDVSLCSADKFLVAGGLTHVGKTSHFADGGCEHPLGSGVTSHTHTHTHTGGRRCSLWLYTNPSFRDFLFKIKPDT